MQKNVVALFYTECFISACRDKTKGFGHSSATTLHHHPPFLQSHPGIWEPLTNTSMDERVLPLNPIPPPWWSTHTFTPARTHTRPPLSPASSFLLCSQTHTHRALAEEHGHTIATTHILAPSHTYLMCLDSISHSFIYYHRPQTEAYIHSLSGVSRCDCVFACVGVCVCVLSDIWGRCLSGPYKMS